MHLELEPGDISAHFIDLFYSSLFLASAKATDPRKDFVHTRYPCNIETNANGECQLYTISPGKNSNSKCSSFIGHIVNSSSIMLL